MKPNKELKAELGVILEIPVWRALLLLFVVFGCGGMFVLTAQAAVAGRVAPTAVAQFITATPSPVPSATATPTPTGDVFIEGIGQPVEVRLNWRLSALGVAYHHNGQWVERLYCDPIPADYLCRFPRPPLTKGTAASFNLMVREGEIWHHVIADPTQTYLTVEWGVEGNLYRFFVSSRQGE
jgi:hypothetical protein